MAGGTFIDIHAIVVYTNIIANHVSVSHCLYKSQDAGSNQCFEAVIVITIASSSLRGPLSHLQKNVSQTKPGRLHCFPTRDAGKSLVNVLGRWPTICRRLLRATCDIFVSHFRSQFLPLSRPPVNNGV